MWEIYLEHGLLFFAFALAPIGLVVLIVAAFRRSRRGLLTGAPCIGLAAALLLRVRYAEFWNIDTCLDSGGGWNETLQSCER